MTRVFIASAGSEERAALQLLLQNLNLDIAGESADWATTLAQVPRSCADMLVVDWDIVAGAAPAASAALNELRRACPASIDVVLVSRLDAPRQAAVSSGADIFISKTDPVERVADRLLALADGIRAPDAAI